MTKGLNFSGVFDKAQHEEEEPTENDIDSDDSEPRYVFHFGKSRSLVLTILFHVINSWELEEGLNDER